MSNKIIINGVITMLLATASAIVVADTGGSAYGFIQIDKVECKNKSADEKVVIKNIVNNSWDCEQAGLEIDTGDIISIKITGTAQGLIPNPPLNLAAASGIDSAVLSWDVVAGAVSYNIYRTMNPGFAANETNLIANAAESPYEDVGLVRGVAYYYLITAIGSSGESLPSGEISITLPPLGNPTPGGGSGGTTPPPVAGGGGGGTTPPPVAGGGSGGTTPPPVAGGGGGTTPPPVAGGGGGGTTPPPVAGGGNPNPPGAGMGGVGTPPPPPPPAGGVGTLPVL